MNENEIVTFFTAAAMAIQNNDERNIKRARTILAGRGDPFPEDDQSFYTVAALAKLMDCSERTITSLIDVGALKGFKLGGKRMVGKRDFDEFVLRNQISCK